MVARPAPQEGDGLANLSKQDFVIRIIRCRVESGMLTMRLPCTVQTANAERACSTHRSNHGRQDRRDTRPALKWSVEARFLLQAGAGSVWGLGGGVWPPP